MRKNRDIWLATVRRYEGGYVDHPQDKGGPTNMGITQATLERWRGQPVSAEDVKNLTWAEASEIYLALYWNRIHGDEMPGGLDMALGDAVVTSNMARQVKLLQGILGVEQDGYVGPKTIAAARAADTADTIRRFMEARLDYLHSLDDWPVFGRGWGNRCLDVEQTCLAMVESNVRESGVVTGWPAAWKAVIAAGAAAPLWLPSVVDLLAQGKALRDGAGAAGLEGPTMAVVVGVGLLGNIIASYRKWLAARSR